jgi:hypothetical protein
MGDTWWAAAAKHKLALALMHAADVLHAKDKQPAPAAEEGTAPGMDADLRSSRGYGVSHVLLSSMDEAHDNWNDALIGEGLFSDSSSADYWSSLGLNFELDVAGNIISIGQLEGES